MKCSKCAADIAQDAQFCAKCGTKVSSDNSSSDHGQAGPTKTTIENIADISAEKWKELSPKAKQAAVEAGEKASAMSKDIASELKQSGAALRQAIEENKGDGSQTKAQVIGKTATSFLGKLSGKQKAILAGAVVLSVVVLSTVFSSSVPEDRCVITGLSGMGENGIYPGAKAERITPLQCQLVGEYLAHFKCDKNEVYRFISKNPKEALSTMIQNPPDGDIKNAKETASAVRSACGW